MMDQIEFVDYQRKFLEFKHKMCKKWQDAGINALISPAFPHCAFESKNIEELGSFYEYVTMWNMLGFPAGVLPITIVEQSETKVEYTDSWNDRWTRSINEDIKTSEGMPIAVQVVAYS